MTNGNKLENLPIDDAFNFEYLNVLGFLACKGKQGSDPVIIIILART
jgi:hypothetical protein